MKKSLLLFLIVMVNSQGLFSPTSNVYLCDSSGGKKYHYTKSCRRLSNCKAEIISVSLQKARTLGKELCGWED